MSCTSCSKATGSGPATATGGQIRSIALTRPRAVGVRILVVDELQNVLAGSGERRREFLNLIRFLGNELRVPLVGVGTREDWLTTCSPMSSRPERRFAGPEQ
jgi:ABC-type molybdate transport system ATPase subunit